MAVSESRDVVIAATPDEIMRVLLDVEMLPDWSSVHQTVEVLERDDQGHPLRSRQVVKLVGFTEQQVLAYTVHDDGVSWTLVEAKQQKAQDGRYTLIPEGDATRVRFDLIVELSAPVPGFFVRQGARALVDTATKGLRKRVLRVKMGG